MNVAGKSSACRRGLLPRYFSGPRTLRDPSVTSKASLNPEDVRDEKVKAKRAGVDTEQRGRKANPQKQVEGPRLGCSERLKWASSARRQSTSAWVQERHRRRLRKALRMLGDAKVTKCTCFCRNRSFLDCTERRKSPWADAESMFAARVVSMTKARLCQASASWDQF